MKIRQIALLRTMAVVNFFILVGQQGTFSATGANDARTIAKLAAEGRFDEGSYGMTALVYAVLPEALRQVLVYVIGGWFILYSLRRLQTNVHGLAMLFLALAPSILTVATFQKDLLLVPFLIAAAWSLERFPKGGVLVAAIAGVYGFYGYLFRDYYYLILFFFLLILAVRKLALQWKLLLFLGLILILMVTPVSILQTLEGPRDTINYYRLRDPNFVGARTAFTNLLPIDGAWSFTVNYVYALIRLNLAFFLDPGPKELFLELNVAAYFLAIFSGFRQGSRIARNAASLLLAHVIVLTFFEPDLGSYMRHLASTLPIAAIPIAEYFSRRKWRFVWRMGDPCREREDSTATSGSHLSSNQRRSQWVTGASTKR